MKWRIFGIIFLLSNGCIAQNALLQLEVSHQRDTVRAFSGIDSLNVQRLETQFRLPLLAVSSLAGTWYGGFEFSENRMVLTGSVTDTRRFYRFALPFQFHLKSSKPWQHVIHYQPAYYSDESMIEQTRYVHEFAWIVKYQANRKAVWVMGVRKDTRFGTDTRYPVLGLESRPNSMIYHHWVFPDLYSEVVLNQRQSVQLFAKPSGGNWRYLQGDGSVASFSMTDWHVGAAWVQSLRQPLQLKIEMGMNMYGEGSVAGSDGDFEDGYFFSLSLHTQILE